MKKKLTIDPAWVIFFMVASTLVVLNFMDDEQKRNLVAGIILMSTFVLFFVSVLMRSLPQRAKAKL